MKIIGILKAAFCSPADIKQSFTQKVIGLSKILITDRQHMSRLKYQFFQQSSFYNAKKNSILAVGKLTSGIILWLSNPVSSLSVQAELGRVSGVVIENILVKMAIRGQYSKLLKLLSLLPATIYLSMGLLILDKLTSSWTLSLGGNLVDSAILLYFTAFSVQLAQFLTQNWNSKERNLKKIWELAFKSGPLWQYAFCLAGFQQFALAAVWLQSVYLVSRGLVQGKNVLQEWIGQRATEIVNPQVLKMSALQNKYVKEISNMKAIREGQKFRFTCHAVLNIQKMKQKLKENNKGDTEQALLLSNDISHQQETLRTMVKNVPYLVLNQVQMQLTKVQNKILFEYPRCSRIDIELDHTKQLNNFTLDDEQAVRIYWQQLSHQDTKNIIMDSDWLLNEIERRTARVSINSKRQLDRGNWLEMLQKE